MARVLDVQATIAPPERLVGTVGELWRYPIKSMLGERVPEVVVTGRGCLGDRAWALRDRASGRIASAERFPRLLGFRSAYELEPTSDSRGRARIEAPDGRSISTDDPEASHIISEILGRELRLESQPRADETTGIDRRTVFGDVPVSQMKPDWTPETMPDYFRLKSDSFFEIGAVFVLTSGSAAHLGRLQGAAGPADRRRFRPNLYLDTGPGSERFVEDAWAGRALRVGGEVVLTDFAPTLWCVTSTLAQEELPRDLSVLRTAAQAHGGCLGVYASVRSPGRIRVGDPVHLL
jgi:uncharacterized protein YcbX